MTNKRKIPPPTPFFTVSEQTNEPRAKREKMAQNDAENHNQSVNEARKNGFIIPKKLPSFNEYINACRTNRYKGARLKEAAEAIITFAILQALQNGQLRHLTSPIRLEFIWHEKTKRRDADNIASAKKFILDAMQRIDVIPNDNRKYVTGFTDKIVDDTRNFVEVRIIEEAPPGGGT